MGNLDLYRELMRRGMTAANEVLIVWRVGSSLRQAAAALATSCVFFLRWDDTGSCLVLIRVVVLYFGSRPEGPRYGTKIADSRCSSA